MNRLALLAFATIVTAAASYLVIVEPAAMADSDKSAAPDEAAIDRTRNTVKMLDDVYKTAVVLITDKYVHDEDDFPAGSAAIALFDAVTKKGWHDVRLIDVTGEPYDEKNVAKDSFEKEGVRLLKSGKPYYEQVVQQDDGYRLRAITPIPVVLQKCVMCHAHYADVKEGAAIGAISYSIPIE